jgi:hypothetical protein
MTQQNAALSSKPACRCLHDEQAQRLMQVVCAFNVGAYTSHTSHASHARPTGAAKQRTKTAQTRPPPTANSHPAQSQSKTPPKVANAPTRQIAASPAAKEGEWENF